MTSVAFIVLILLARILDATSLECTKLVVSGGTNTSNNVTCKSDTDVCFSYEGYNTDEMAIFAGCLPSLACGSCSGFFPERNFTRCCMTCCGIDYCNANATFTNCSSSPDLTTTSTTQQTTTITQTTAKPTATSTTVIQTATATTGGTTTHDATSDGEVASNTTFNPTTHIVRNVTCGTMAVRHGGVGYSKVVIFAAVAAYLRANTV